MFVRADLGQIEPRVLAVVSGDPAFAAATRADDLYAPVAQRLGVDRPVAKVAVLAAMYGQRSGAAGEALEGLERAYPVAMALLDRAYAAGRRGEPLRTYGGRLIPTGRFLAGEPGGRRPRAGLPPAGGSRATPSSRGPRPSCSRRGPRRCGRRPATSGPRSCCACTTSCSCTPRPSTPPRWRPGSTGRSTTPHGGGPAAPRCGSSSDTSVIARWSDAKD